MTLIGEAILTLDSNGEPSGAAIFLGLDAEGTAIVAPLKTEKLDPGRWQNNVNDFTPSLSAK